MIKFSENHCRLLDILIYAVRNLSCLWIKMMPIYLPGSIDEAKKNLFVYKILVG